MPPHRVPEVVQLSGSNGSAVAKAANDGWIFFTMEDEPIRIPITPELDLHTFRPNEVGDLLVDYLSECQLAGILNVRVIHGKGTGTLRTGVHAALAKMPIVRDYTWPADLASGSWGATWVHLQALNPSTNEG